MSGQTPRGGRVINLERDALIEQITDLIVSRLRADGGIEVEDSHACSPHSIACAIQAGASRIGLAAGQASAGSGEVSKYIDHTLLKPEASRVEIENLCAEAKRFDFASVCVNPTWVRDCAFALYGSTVKVCTVVGFPLGATLPDVKAYEARRTIFDGATEIDMVINIGALKSSDDETVLRDIRHVVEVSHEVMRYREGDP